MVYNNETYLNTIKKTYESLRDFSIVNNVLYYKSGNVTYQLPLIVNLSAFNDTLYTLSPEEIINVLYVFQLLYKTELTKDEENLLVKYTNKYFEYNNNPEYNSSSVFGLSIPVYTSYEDAFTNSPGAIIIRRELSNKSKELEEYQNSIQGKEKQLIKKLERTDLPTSAYLDYEEFAEKLNDIQNAGFTTLFLILGTVVITAITLLAIA